MRIGKLYDQSKIIRSEKFLKSSVMKKASGLLATMLLLSTMLPVLAFAGTAYFKNVIFYPNGTVSGTVYSTANQGNTVNVSVYGVKNSVYGTSYPDLKISVTTSAYSYDVTNSVYNYNFTSNSVIDSTYNPIVLKAFNADGDYLGVSDAVYRQVQSNRRGGGGGGIASPSGNTTLSASQIAAAFANGNVATFTINGESATLPASALVNAPAGAIVVIKNATGSYSLPVDVLDFDALAEELGVEVSALNIVITIAKLSDSEASDVNDAASAFGGNVVGSAEFGVAAEAAGKTVAVTDFGSTYVERTINVSEDAASTGALYDPATGEFSFIPSTFANGVAKLKSTTNSIYVVLDLELSFDDVNGHWAQEYVETIANKLIVEGYEDGSFGPDRSITRAEFATLVVRALGLNGKAAADADFSDVSANDWFEGAVALAADAGIVNGYEDGTFKPNKVITREELAAMVVRASAYAGKELSASASVLAAFSDADSIVWANDEIAAAVEAGIVNGYEDGTFGPTKTATRAEATTMIQRFLVNVDFINE